MAEPHTSTISTVARIGHRPNLFSEETAISRIRDDASSINSINAALLVQRIFSRVINCNRDEAIRVELGTKFPAVGQKNKFCETELYNRN